MALVAARQVKMGPKLMLALASVAVLLPACKKHATMDIPPYPGSSQVSAIPNQETEAGTLFHVRRATPDALRTVSDFYRRELVEKRGWSEQASVGPAFTDGNMRVERPGQMTATATPVDPSLPGSFVLVYESRNATYVETWQHVPPAK